MGQARVPQVTRILVAVLMLLSTSALPHDGHHENDAWFKSLRSVGGMGCCDGTDAQRVDDLDWKTEDNGEYSVRIKGEWFHITKDQIVTVPNKVGYAIVWIWQNKITCFMAGQLS